MDQRWKVTCAYDGTAFNGWQSQPNGDTVQDAIEARLETVFARKIRITGSGRTDTGVHARGQVFHFDAEWRTDGERLRHALRTGLPESIHIREVRAVSTGFHALHSARAKQYAYRLHKYQAPPHLARYCHSLCGRPLQENGLVETAKAFEGWHDFRAFAANRGKPYEDTWRYIASARVSRSGALWLIRFEGNGFMYKMVRSMVGTMIEVASGRLTVEQVRHLLQGNDRTHRVVTAPAKGLTLEKVYYRARGYPDRPSVSG